MTNEAKMLTGIGLVSVVIITIAAFAFGGSSGPKQQEVLSAEAQSSLVKSDSYKIAAKNEKVTIVEFGDFQCPACGYAYPVVEQIIEEYKDTVTFVFRQFPLSAHKNGEVAAEAAEAAGAQGKFFEMYRMLYDKQEEWSESDKALDEHFVKYAKELKLDEKKFKEDVAGKKYAKRIQADVNDGTALGVNATPTFYINGEKQVGGLTYDEFKKKIDTILAESK